MSLILRMLRKNVSLHQWRTFIDTGDGAGFFSQKSPDKIAQTIFSGLSHPDTVTLVAQEFAILPQQVRLSLRDLANSGNASGNVRTGVQRLNELLKGELLREESQRVFNKRVETVDGARYRQIKVNPAVAGAKRKYGG